LGRIKEKNFEAYTPKYYAKDLCICFQELQQKSDETVKDVYNRVSDTFRNAYQTKIYHNGTYKGAQPGVATQA
jgi:hypothetical protein